MGAPTTCSSPPSAPHLLLCLSPLLCFMVMIPTMMACIQPERESLLEFKAGLVDPSGVLSSWVGDGCCGWRGVKCSNRTGHVISLHLRNDFRDSTLGLGGDINPSLLGLKHLEHLDLSGNDFQGIPIPSFIGSLRSLRYLNLSAAGFYGSVPHQLGNLSSLHLLDLSTFSKFRYPIYMDSGRWLSHLRSLKYLNLDGVDLSRASGWLESVNGLPSLSEIHMSYCELLYIPPHLPHVNFTSLRLLDLFGNRINSTIPPWLFKITGLRYLDLGYNSFQRLVPASIGNLTSLTVLDLSSNGEIIEGIPTAVGNLCALTELDLSGNTFGGKFNELGPVFSAGCIKESLKTLFWSGGDLTGTLPDWLGGMKNLRTLQLAGNKLNGTIPETLGQLSELVKLDLAGNDLEGVLSEAHFSNLTRLESLHLSSNSQLALDVGSGWVPPLRLTYLGCGSVKLGPPFPAWLRELQNLSYIDISNAGISDVMPDWFWNFSSTISSVDLSRNEIRGTLHAGSPTHLMNLSYVKLSHNRFEGPIPQFSSPLLQVLDLSNNSLSGTIYPNINELVPNMQYLSVSANNISGNIPLSICKLEQLQTLYLSTNHLSGEIPNCWDHHESMWYMDLSNNQLSGGIPSSIWSIPYLLSLHLSGNDLSGELPPTFGNWTKMAILDLGHNKLSGIIPIWIGERLQALKALRLRSNLLVGNIPPQLGNLQGLHIIDLAHNYLSGTIPRSFGNLSAIKVVIGADRMPTWVGLQNNLDVNMKGREDEYDTLLDLVMSIDLAYNNLTGGIPEELTTLSELRNLNLSGNHLTGKIAEKIGGLQWLESLDLSFNDLSGAIPKTMASMHSLSVLNLSFNNFSGEIPSGGQLQALTDPSIYIGNLGLCGFPLNMKCHDHDGASQPLQPVKSDESDSEMEGFYLSIGSGFAVGLWTVYIILLLNKKWRIAHSRFADRMYDKAYVVLAIRMAKMKNRY